MEGQGGAAAELSTAGELGGGVAGRSRAERRQFERFAVDCVAAVTILSGSTTIRGRLRDLCLGGCQMAASWPVSLGIFARVEIVFELRGYAFRVVGVTAGTRGKREFGMRFLEMPAGRVEALRALIEEIRSTPEVPVMAGREKMVPPMEELRRLREKEQRSEISLSRGGPRAL